MSENISLFNDYSRVESGLQIDVVTGQAFAMNRQRQKKYFQALSGFYDDMRSQNPDENLVAHAWVLGKVAEVAESRELTPERVDGFAGRIIMANKFAVEHIPETNEEHREEVIRWVVDAAFDLDPDKADEEARFAMYMARIKLSSTAYQAGTIEEGEDLVPFSIRDRQFVDETVDEQGKFVDPAEGLGRGAYYSYGDLVELYLSQIRKYREIPYDEQIILGRNVRAGLAAQKIMENLDPEDPGREWLQRFVEEGEWARETFVKGNLRLPIFVDIDLIGGRGQEKDHMKKLDIYNEGNTGVMAAVDGFDPERGFKFSTYATTWVRSKIGKGIKRQERMIHLPFAKMELLQKVYAVYRKCLDENAPNGDMSKLPTVAEIVETSEGTLSKEEAEAGLELMKQQVHSYDEPVDNGEGDVVTRADSMSMAVDDGLDEAGLDLDREADRVRMPSRERLVLSLIFGVYYSEFSGNTYVLDGETFTYDEAVELAAGGRFRNKDVGKILGVSQSSAGVLKKKALKRLKNSASLEEWYNG